MKSKAFIFSIFLITLFACKDDNVPETPVPIPAMFAEAYASPSSVPYNGATTLIWKSQSVISITKDGIPLPTKNGSEDLTSLIKDTSFTFEFKGLDGQVITKSVFITVGVQPIPTRTDSLCAKALYLTEEKVLVDGVWTYTNLQELQMTSPLYFYPNGKYKKFRPDGITSLASGTWSWDGPNTINMDGWGYKYLLTETQFMRFKRNDTGIEIYTRK